jgi:proton-dependent oligopeptide transporter, POT family
MTSHPSGISQTRSFTAVFLIEMWERFGYYGMAALLVLFMIGKIGFTDEHANLTWGAFTALAYAAPSIGGWIGDKILGARRTMIVGALVLSAGYLMLAMPIDALGYMYASLGVIVVGNGLFKANAANLVRRIYEGDDARLDSAFTIYYMAVNIGSTISMLATPWIKDHWGWHAAFAVCCAGMLIGLLNFFMMRRALRHIGSIPDDLPLRWSRLAAVAAGAVALGLATVFIVAERSGGGGVRVRRGRRHPGDLRLHAAEVRSERTFRLACRIDPDAAGHLVLRVLSTDVDFAHALCAAQCRSVVLARRRDVVHVERRSSRPSTRYGSW